MGQPSTSAPDIAAAVSQAPLVAANETTRPIAMTGAYNATVSGTFVAQLALERTFDGGATWVPVPDGAGGTVVAAGPTSLVLYEPEDGVLYRWRVSSFSSGSAVARVSR